MFAIAEQRQIRAAGNEISVWLCLGAKGTKT